MSLSIVSESIAQHQRAVQAVEKTLQPLIAEVAALVAAAVRSGRTLFLCGNGGSAADAQHIAAEFTGRFVKERRGLPAVALTTDTSALTAIGNDYGYERIFSRQIEALGQPGDLLMAISTSGNSANIIEAVRTANQNGLVTIGLSGGGGGALTEHCRFTLAVPATTTARIQEMHILIGHIICEVADRAEADIATAGRLV